MRAKQEWGGFGLGKMNEIEGHYAHYRGGRDYSLFGTGHGNDTCDQNNPANALMWDMSARMVVGQQPAY